MQQVAISYFTVNAYPKAKKKYCLFPVSNGLKENRVGRSVNKCFCINFWSKMCVLCTFYVNWQLGGREKFKGRDFFV